MARTLTHLRGASWALLFLTLTVTNFPYFPGGLGGRTLIRPLAVYPLILLVLLVTLPRLFTRPLPRTFLPLAAFAVVALVSSLLALSYGQGALRGISMADRVLRNLITLGLGGAFYLTVVLYPDSREDLHASLRWLYLGFAIALAWGTLQAVYVVSFSREYFEFISEIQAFISTRRLFTTRISGLTYEPKWFAEQITFLLMPWLFASVLLRRSLFRWRYRRITVESLLLVWAAGVLVFTYSRTGLLILVLLVTLSIALGRPRRAKTASTGSKAPRLIKTVLALTAVLAIIFVAGTQNKYFSRMWRYWTGDAPENQTYLEYIAFSQRFAYWTTAYNIYEAYPILGVGLGNYAFYFREMLPNQTYDGSQEILRHLVPSEGADRLITPKHLYARLLAETGIVGTVLFTTFILAVLGCALSLWVQPDPELKFWGLSGLLGLVAFAVMIFSFDSFAVPNMWIVFGFITAAAHLPQSAGAENARLAAREAEERPNVEVMPHAG